MLAKLDVTVIRCSKLPVIAMEIVYQTERWCNGVIVCQRTSDSISGVFEDGINRL